MASPRAFTSAVSILGRPTGHSATALRALPAVIPRQYHSYDHPPPPPVFNAAEDTILAAAYSHIPEHGFTQRALNLGAKDAGYLDISTSVLPNGVFSLIKYHLVVSRQALAIQSGDILNGPEKDRLLQVSDKVERLTWERLLANRAINHRWQEALAIMAQPSHVPSSLHELALLSDDILFLSGDTSVDPSWYTKRASLSLNYASSELFMTNDRSPGFSETRAFLQRRLGESDTVGSTLGSLRHWVGFTASAGVNVLRSKGVRI